MDLLDLTPRQLQHAAMIKVSIATLTNELTKSLGASDNCAPTRRGAAESALPERARLLPLSGRDRRNGDRASRWNHGTRARKKTRATVKASRPATT